MREEPLGRKWRVIRAIEASPNGVNATEIAQREETGIRTIYRDLEALQAAGFPLYTERVEEANRRAFIDTFKIRIPPPFTPTGPMSLYFDVKETIESPATYVTGYKSAGLSSLGRFVKVSG